MLRVGAEHDMFKGGVAAQRPYVGKRPIQTDVVGSAAPPETQ